jgi:hypothetical protein
MFSLSRFYYFKCFKNNFGDIFAKKIGARYGWKISEESGVKRKRPKELW